MLLSDGTLIIYDLQNTAAQGEMPKEQLVRRGNTELYYSDRVVGITRAYAARGADQRIDKLVRIWDYEIEIGDYVILDGVDQYRVDLIQPLKDDEGLRVKDLTLVRLEANYDVLAEQA